MVLKPTKSFCDTAPRFENDVEMYGAQTISPMFRYSSAFENDVEMYGAQTQRKIEK